jgi:HPt (histidine-containing phosphotransfer) domain-containing protein
MTPNQVTWKPDHLLEQIGHDLGLAAELVEVFLDEMPEMLSGIEDAVRHSDSQQLASAAHAFKGSAAAIGAFSMAEAAAQLETAGREGRIGAVVGDVAAFAAGAGQLEACLQSTLAGVAA